MIAFIVSGIVQRSNEMVITKTMISELGDFEFELRDIVELYRFSKPRITRNLWPPGAS